MGAVSRAFLRLLLYFEGWFPERHSLYPGSEQGSSHGVACAARAFGVISTKVKTDDKPTYQNVRRQKRAKKDRG